MRKPTPPRFCRTNNAENDAFEDDDNDDDDDDDDNDDGHSRRRRGLVREKFIKFAGKK